jgi:hypothetical protein
MKDILPSMPKGEIVGNMAIAEMTQTVTVVIDGNRLVMEHAQEMLELMEIGWLWSTHNNAETQDAETQMLKHRC